MILKRVGYLLIPSVPYSFFQILYSINSFRCYDCGKKLIKQKCPRDGHCPQVDYVLVGGVDH